MLICKVLYLINFRNFKNYQLIKKNCDKICYLLVFSINIMIDINFFEYFFR